MLFAFEKQEPSKKRTIIGLESLMEQLSVFQSISPEGQDHMLHGAALGASTGETGKLITLYESGDEAALTALIESGRGSKDPEAEKFQKALIDRRNVTMTDRIGPCSISPDAPW